MEESQGLPGWEMDWGCLKGPGRVWLLWVPASSPALAIPLLVLCLSLRISVLALK